MRVSLAIALVLAARSADACSAISYPVGVSPPPPPTAHEKLEESEYVFAGTVLGIWRLDRDGVRIPHDAPIQEGSSYDPETRTLTILSEGPGSLREADFHIRAAWKGIDDEVWTLRFRATGCNPSSFVIGETYLVYASDGLDAQVADERLLSASTADVKELGRVQFLFDVITP